MTPKQLQEHIFSTYSHIRVGMIAIASLSPFLLLFGGLFHGINWQDSMSAYYYATVGAAPPAMRVWLIGLLYALGVFLFLYKGFSKLEDWCLNVAGIFAVGVARFPMPWPADSGSGFSMHYFCAVSMFICIGIVTWFCTGQTLGLVKDTNLRMWFKRGYRAAGSAMIVLPLLIWLYKEFFPNLAKGSHLTFCLEVVCIWAFALYWFIKSWELRGSMAELEALNGKLSTEPSSVTLPVPGKKIAFPGQIVDRMKKLSGDRLAPARWI